jgi:alpha-galactosidase
MRQEWGCTYFKLDANFWGAMHGGRFYDPKATRIEAYRRGMQAILRGAGDSFILGCNHPIWGSFGLIHGSRSSGDVSRRWTTMKKIARETLYRNWQNGSLWWNDPDCVLQTGSLTPDELQFHATAVYASGGMVLAGDDLSKLAPGGMGVLKRFLPPAGIAAEFEDESLAIGVIPIPGKPMVCVFNWDDEPRTVVAKLPKPGVLVDFWTGAELGRQERSLELKQMAPHSARLLAYR